MYILLLLWLSATCYHTTVMIQTLRFLNVIYPQSLLFGLILVLLSDRYPLPLLPVVMSHIGDPPPLHQCRLGYSHSSC